MLLQATYNELNAIISDKAQIKGLALDYCSTDTAKVSYKFSILGMKPTVSCRIQITSIEGSRITANINAGSIGDLVIGLTKKSFIKKTPEGLIESFKDKTVVMNLDAIPELKAVFEAITVNNITFTEENVLLDANLKQSRQEQDQN